MPATSRTSTTSKRFTGNPSSMGLKTVRITRWSGRSDAPPHDIEQQEPPQPDKAAGNWTLGEGKGDLPESRPFLPLSKPPGSFPGPSAALTDVLQGVAV